LHDWVKTNNSLNEIRGAPLYIDKIPTIATFFPQDCCDPKNHEKDFNDQYKTQLEDQEGEEEDESDVKTHSITKRANYSFWFINDFNKAKRIIREKLDKWPIEREPTYRLYPGSQEVIDHLMSVKGGEMVFDIETDYEEQNLLTFSYSFTPDTVYCVPVLGTDYKPTYTQFPYIFKALVHAIKHNLLIAHNGGNFDFLVLGHKYNIPVYEVYDTMVAWHRCFPEVEQSLGHLTSYCTFQPFHKDTDSRGYFTKEQMMAKLLYNGKDVFTTRLVYEWLKHYSRKIPGLSESIALANKSIRPYLITTLQGIRYSSKILDKMCSDNDRLMEQYLRIIGILIGDKGMAQVKTAVKSKAPSAFPSSNAQCVKYFHDLLGYEVQKRSDKTGKASLGKGLMYKLALLYDNPVIKFTMLYRALAKETSTLRFVPWKDDANKPINFEEMDK
jgi:hypothetical protein